MKVYHGDVSKSPTLPNSQVIGCDSIAVKLMRRGIGQFPLAVKPLCKRLYALSLKRFRHSLPLVRHSLNSASTRTIQALIPLNCGCFRTCQFLTRYLLEIHSRLTQSRSIFARPSTVSRNL